MIIIAFIISTLVGAFFAYGSDREEQGRMDERAKMLLEHQKQIDKMLRKKDKELDDAVVARDKWKKKAIDLQSKPPKEVKVYVDRIVENNDCTRIEHFSELFNKLRENYN